MTKLAKILESKSMSQRDLQRAIQDRYGVKIGDDRISKIFTGRMKNYQLKTALLIATTLEVSVDDIIEI
jgi:DNA-binding Xre family transcriptional regulator